MMRAYGVDMTQAEFLEKVTKVPGQLGELYKGVPAHVMHSLGFTLKNVTELSGIPDMKLSHYLGMPAVGAVTYPPWQPNVHVVIAGDTEHLFALGSPEDGKRSAHACGRRGEDRSRHGDEQGRQCRFATGAMRRSRAIATGGYRPKAAVRGGQQTARCGHSRVIISKS